MLKDIGRAVFQADKGGFELNLYEFDEAQFFAKRAALLADRTCVCKSRVCKSRVSHQPSHHLNDQKRLIAQWLVITCQRVAHGV